MLGIFFCSRSDPIEVEQEWTIQSLQTEVPWIDPLHTVLGLFRFHLQRRPTSLPSHIHHRSVLCMNTVRIIINSDKPFGLAYTGEREKGIQQK